MSMPYDHNAPCLVRHCCTKRMNWEEVVKTGEDFDRFVSKLLDFHKSAEKDGMVLRVEVHQLDEEDCRG